MIGKHPLDRYIQQRKQGGNFVFRRRYPKELHPTLGWEFIRSLKTTDYALALLKAQACLDYTEDLIQKAKGKTQALSEPMAWFRLTIKMADHFHAMSSVDRQTFYQRSKSEDFIRGEFEAFCDKQGIFLLPSSSEYETQLASFKRAVSSFIMSFELNFQNQKLSKQLIELKSKSDEYADLISNPDVDKFEQKIYIEKDNLPKPMPIISAIFQEFLSFNPQISNSPKELTRYSNIITSFIEFAGDVPINHIDKTKVRAFILKLNDYPANRDSKSLAMTFGEAIKYHTKKGEYVRVSETTVKAWIAKLKRLWAYAITWAT